MGKSKLRQYFCTECKLVTTLQKEKCPSCGALNTLVNCTVKYRNNSTDIYYFEHNSDLFQVYSKIEHPIYVRYKFDPIENNTLLDEINYAYKSKNSNSLFKILINRLGIKFLRRLPFRILNLIVSIQDKMGKWR